MSNRHPSTEAITQWFDHRHLRAGKPQDVSMEVGDLAARMVTALPDGPELTTGLRKLLEAKDCFVRAAIEQERTQA